MILETQSKRRADALQSPIHAALESGRYPPWLVEMVTDTNESAQTVTQHEAWFRFRDGNISRKEHHALLMGLWPLFERFPKFLALNLLKCDYGSDSVMNAVRDWLIKNLRTEQWHTRMYRDWAVSAGVEEEALFQGERSEGAQALSDWCWQVSKNEGLAEALAATVFAIQRVTGQWAKTLSESGDYQSLFEESERKHALQWVHAYSARDRRQLVESLDIIRELLGDNPNEQSVNRVKQAIEKSYVLYAGALDEVLGHA